MKIFLTRISSLFLFCLINTLFLNAQSEFHLGYVVDLNNDTIHGVIKEELSAYGFDIILKENRESKEKTKFTSSNTQTVHFTNSDELYKKGPVKINDQVVQVFFKCLVLGEVDLYAYIDNAQKKRYFIDSEELGTRELLVTTINKLDSQTGKRYTSQINSFQGILKLALKDCPANFSKIDQLKL